MLYCPFDFIHVLLKFQFAAEGRINPDFIKDEESIDEVETGNEPVVNPVEKRRRHLSLCLRRSGRRFRPVPCYKSVGKIIFHMYFVVTVDIDD